MSDIFSQGMSSVTKADIANASGGGLIPKGVYNVQCEGAKVDTTQTGTSYFEFKFRILGPTNAGRIVFQKYWIASQNKKYVGQCFAKIQDFAVKAGFTEEQAKALQPAGFVGLKAGCGVVIEKSDNPSYPDKNGVSYFRKFVSEMDTAINGALPNPVANQVQPSQSTEEKYQASPNTNFAASDIPF